MSKIIKPIDDRAELKAETKRLKRLLKELRNDFDNLSASKRWGLIKRVIIILVKLEIERAKDNR